MNLDVAQVDFALDAPASKAPGSSVGTRSRIASLSREGHSALVAQLDFRPNVAINMVFLVGDVLLLSLSIYLLRFGGTTGFIASQLLLVLVFLHSFSIFHECGHGTAARSKLLNTVMGHYTSLFSFMPFFPWKYMHGRHHSFTGNLDKDPTLKLVREFDQSRQLRNSILSWCWRLWIPLGALMQHLVVWAYPMTIKNDPSYTNKHYRNNAFSIAFPLCVYAVLFAMWPAIFNIENFGVAILIYFVVVELVNFPHHLDTDLIRDEEGIDKLPLWQQSRVTRSCFYPKGVSEFFLLNFNFHTEHHLFPRLPWHRLRQARALIKPALGDQYRESEAMSWSLNARKAGAIKVLGRYRARRHSTKTIDAGRPAGDAHSDLIGSQP